MCRWRSSDASMHGVTIADLTGLERRRQLLEARQGGALLELLVHLDLGVELRAHLLQLRLPPAGDYRLNRINCRG